MNIEMRYNVKQDDSTNPILNAIMELHMNGGTWVWCHAYIHADSGNFVQLDIEMTSDPDHMCETAEQDVSSKQRDYIQAFIYSRIGQEFKPDWGYYLFIKYEPDAVVDVYIMDEFLR